MWIFLTTGLVALVHAGVAAAQSLKPGTTWINQFESTLTIDAVDGQTGALKGTFVSHLGQNCIGTKHEAVGWVDDERVVFSVHWKTPAADCQSITSWAGYVAKGTLVALWNLAYLNTGDSTSSIHRGTDIFQPCVAAGNPKGCPEPVASVTPAPADPPAAPADPPAAPTAEATRQPEPADTRQQAASAPPVNPELDRLMARAATLIGQGDVGSARIVLERAADTGTPQAIFALAETYDPLVLATWRTMGTRGDITKARELYEKALAGGVTAAKDRLSALASVKQ